MKKSLRWWILTGCAAAAQVLWGAEGNAEEAIQRAREAFRSTQAELGPDDPATAMTLRELALAFEQGGYHQYAEVYASRSLAALEARFGRSDVILVPALNVLAEAYAGQGRNSEALRTEMRAVQIGPGAGKFYGTALHNAAALLYRLGRFTESGELFVRALGVMEATLPAGHPYIEATRAALNTAQKAARSKHK